MNTYQNLFPRPNIIQLPSQSPQIKTLPQQYAKTNQPVIRAISNNHLPHINSDLSNNDFIPSSLTFPNPNRVMNPLNNLKPVNIINMNNPQINNITPVQPINNLLPLNNNNNLIRNPNIPNPISQGTIIINNNNINKINPITNAMNSPRTIRTNPNPISQGSIIINKNNIQPFNTNIVTNNNIINDKAYVGLGNTPTKNNTNSITNLVPMNNLNNNIKPVSVINMRNNLVPINNNLPLNQPINLPPVTIPNPGPTPTPINIQPSPIPKPTPVPITIPNQTPKQVVIQNPTPTTTTSSSIIINNQNPVPVPVPVTIPTTSSLTVKNPNPTPVTIINQTPKPITPITIPNPTPTTTSSIVIQNHNQTVPKPLIIPSSAPVTIQNQNQTQINIPNSISKPTLMQTNIQPLNQNKNLLPVAINPVNLINPPKTNIIPMNIINTPSKSNIIPINQMNQPKPGLISLNPINQPKTNIVQIIPNKSNIIPINSSTTNIIPMNPPQTNINNIIPFQNSNLIPSAQLNLNEFEIEQEIGKGSFGEIFRVKWKLNQKYYAMKIEYLDAMEGINTRLNRGEAMRKFVQSTGCPGVVNIYGSYYIRKGAGFVYYELMDLCNTDFEKEIKMRSEFGSYYTEGELDNIIKQLISTLSFLQKNHITHRDIKPQNILIANGKYKLCDFGDIRVMQREGIVIQRIRGSELYMSPILFNGLRSGLVQVQHNTYKSDVFSLGMCLFYAACLSFDGPVEIREVINMDIKLRILNKYLAARYSNKLIKILHLMLQTEESIRPDFIMLEDGIIKYGL